MAYEHVDLERTRAWAQAALMAETEAVRMAPPREANVTLNRAAYALGQIAGAGHLEVVQVEDALLGAARERRIPLPEARATIRSGLRAGQRSPRGPSEHQESPLPQPFKGSNDEQVGARAFAARLWRSAQPAAGTPAEAYLHHRGILGPLPSSLRFSAAVPMPGGSRHPAMLAEITDPVTGEFLALQRTALTPEGRKADIEPQKATIGSSAGGAVVIGDLSRAEFVAEGEGVETVLSATSVCDLAGIATLSSSTIGCVPLPQSTTSVVILGEHGSEHRAEEAAKRRHAEGRRVFVAYPPDKEHKDLNDFLTKCGPEAVVSLLTSLQEWQPPADPETEPDMSIVERTVLCAPELDLSLFGPWAKWIESAAAAKNAPADYVAMALLGSAAGVIGATRWVSPWSGWSEPAILWTMLVGNPSASKSPAMDVIREALTPLERELFTAYQSKRQQFETDAAVAKANEEAWQAEIKVSAKKGGMTPPKPEAAKTPEAPILERITVTDTTIEAAAVIVATNPRGVILWRDELSAWIGNIEKYGLGDRAFWLEGYGGRSYTVDRRKLGAPLLIPYLAISVVGGIQPDRLSALVLDAPADGLGERMLYAWPDPIPPQRPTIQIGTQLLRDAFRQLRGLGFFANAETGELMPAFLPVEESALEGFGAWREEHFRDSQRVAGLMADAYGKMPGQVLRIALTFEHLWWAAVPDAPQPTTVTGSALRAAMDLIEGYVKPMLRRIAGEAALPKADRDVTTLARAILERQPERINAREVRRSWRLPGLREAAEVNVAIKSLIEARWLVEVQDKARGRPRQDFEVNPRVYARRQP
jgi:hypothetical protein